MILEAIVGAVTAITLGALALANAIDKRDRAEDVEEDVVPFQEIAVGLPRRKCGRLGKNPVVSPAGMWTGGKDRASRSPASRSSSASCGRRIST